MAENVLAAVDFSDTTDAVLAEAARYARALGAKLWLVHVATSRPEFVGYEIGAVYDRQAVADQLHREHRRLHELQDSLHAEGLDVASLLVPGVPAEKIVAEAQRLSTSLIVVGSHGHGALFDLIAGSACQGVIRHSSVPVLVVPSRGGAR